MTTASPHWLSPGIEIPEILLKSIENSIKIGGFNRKSTLKYFFSFFRILFLKNRKRFPRMF